MAIQYITGSTAFDVSSMTLSNIQSGDLVLLLGSEGGNSFDLTAPDVSWTEGSPFGLDNSGLPDTLFYYKFSTGSSVTATGLSTDSRPVYAMLAFRGVDSSTPFHASGSSTLGSGQPNPPSITTTINGCMIVAVGYGDDDEDAANVTPPSGFTLGPTADSGGGGANVGGTTLATAYLLQSTAGSIDPTSFQGNVLSDSNKSFTLALQPVIIQPPSTGSISLDEVRLYLELATTASLQDCFDTAITAGFDPLYSGSLDRLSNFRGYETPVIPTIPTIESYASATTGGSASTSITFSSAPSGLTAGDLILILIANERNNDWQYQNVTGYTRVTLASNANDIQLGIYYRIATGDANDGFPNLSVTYASSNEFAVGWALRISGVDTTNPIPIFGTYQTGIGSSNQTVPSITTTTDNNLVIMFVGLDGSDVDPITITSGTGWTSGAYAEDDAGDQTLGVYGEWYTKEMSTAGATGTVSMSHGNDGWAGLQFAIKPA